MCGITGIYAFNEIGRVNMINLAAATQVLETRGPDNQGLFNDHFVGLGHRRLSIIDVSYLSNQPMYDDEERYVLVFNGEIYNYQQLKSELAAKGVTFRTESDTEVLLKLFIYYGEECLSKLNGFFAFAIYDRESGKMFVARDRSGIKPLLFYQDQDKVIFASEMKSIFAYGIHRNLDHNTLLEYLQLNYIPSDHSLVKGVRKLLPGHYMWIEPHKVEVKQYYNISKRGFEFGRSNLSYEDAKKELVNRLEESVRKRLVSDVPLGAFLSGGIDSSIITALASRHVDQLNTFSIGYKDEPFFDETSYANLVAEKFNTNHTVFKLTNDDLYQHLNAILDYIDEPFADSSAIPVYVLSRETRKKVTVALSGDGADEIFSGYNKHAAFLRAMNGGTAASMVSSFKPLWDLLPKSRNSPMGNKIRQFQRFAKGMKVSPRERYWLWASISSREDSLNLLNPNIRQELELEKINTFKSELLEPIRPNDMNSLLLMDYNLVLPNDMLTKVDLMSMANSLEVRVPFLDHEVVEFAFSLPAEFKIDASMKKRILQDAFREVLPDQLYKRPKHGFEVPLLKWFRTELRSAIENKYLDDEFIREQGIFNPEEIRHQC